MRDDIIRVHDSIKMIVGALLSCVLMKWCPKLYLDLSHLLIVRYSGVLSGGHFLIFMYSLRWDHLPSYLYRPYTYLEALV